MKSRRITAVLTALLLFSLPACTDTDEPPSAPTNPISAYTLDRFSWAEVPIGEGLPEILPDDKIQNASSPHRIGDLQLNILEMQDGQIYAACRTDKGWLPICRIGEHISYTEWTPFTDVFGRQGECLIYSTGNGRLENQDLTYCYFSMETGIPEMFLQCQYSGGQDTPFFTGDMLITVCRSPYLRMTVYKEENGRFFCCDLNESVTALFPDAESVLLQDISGDRYENHGLLFMAFPKTGTQDPAGYGGWIEDGFLHLIPAVDMPLPPYTFTPTDLQISEDGEQWITEHFGTDFVLRQPTDPTLLSEEELKTYMDEAYFAGMQALRYHSTHAGSLGYTGDTPDYWAEGYRYSSTDNPVFRTLSDWETYLRRILSDEIVDELMSMHIFIEVDGRLYTSYTKDRIAVQSTVDYGSEIVSVSDTEIVYAHTVYVRSQLPEDDETVRREFRYTKTAEGWRWTVLYIYN